ncbi:signal recognition particle-docking protein FtsY [Candidatus Marsarchaeota archaeon]|nr:signal recognition particle-docking protein FtsY [Candidatus Marsarchaeota archaeon]MCL5404952.1 signal recognition particle-docking protein FtsY [Candidatus Marsarchaeota archaeon]
MFDELKKRLSNAIKTIAKREAQESISSEKEDISAPVEAREENPEEASTYESAAAVPSNIQEKGEKEEAAEQKGPQAIKLSAGTKIKSIFVKEVKLSEPEIDRFLENLRMSLLQSDVSYVTTERLLGDIKTRLSETGFSSKSIHAEVTETVRKSLLELLEKGKPKESFLEKVKASIREGKRPVVIMFLGPNGTGKTTTIAKIAYLLNKNGVSTVFSASDTFRAAAIEQTMFHAEKLASPAIRGKYGADPASIAFDAIEYAKSHAKDVVLVDTAGRQETNKNLLNEIAKMERVAKPDFTIYVGESTTGNRAAEQISEFLKFVKIDGIILTKLDCDAKGGNAISISDVTGLPTLFFGTGESYEDLISYDPYFIVNAIFPN